MIPDGWKKKSLEDVAEIRTGLAKGKKTDEAVVHRPYLRVANVQDGYLDLTLMKDIEVREKDIGRYSLEVGDVVLTEGGDFDKLGRGAVWRGQVAGCLHQNHVFAVRTVRSKLLPDFFAAQSASHYGKSYYLSCAKRSTNLASINSTQLKQFPVLVAPLPEQKKITETLETWDRAIDTVEALIANARAQKQALMHQLLPQGTTPPKKRLPGLSGEWRKLHVGDVAKEVSERAGEQTGYPVLSCSKYDGLVESLSYFKKKVYSDDTSNYKVMRRGTFGFPSNHVEEGSIGYQDLCDVGIVSPIYCVFTTSNEVNDGFLYKLLKTDRYRQIFAAATNASVDRRGSLRWKEFSRIPLPLPPLDEQRAISEAVDSVAATETAYQAQLTALRQEKAALMQQLLTGKRRVKLAESEVA